MTSALTFDEVVWNIKKRKGLEASVIAGEAFLETPNLILIPVEDVILWEAVGLIKKYRLNPRDAIHAACAISHGVFTIYSEDSHFDEIKELNRVWTR